MAAGYFEAGKAKQQATFELSIRRLPPRRNFVLAAGLAQCVEYLLNLRFNREAIDYLRGLPQFARVSPAFFDYLRDFRFHRRSVRRRPRARRCSRGAHAHRAGAAHRGADSRDVAAVSAITFQSLIATKGARLVEAGGGRDMVEFGTRRAHTPEAGSARRARCVHRWLRWNQQCARRPALRNSGVRHGGAFLGAFFPSEMESFRQLQKLLGPHTVQLIDTYDTLEGARRAAELGPPLWGVRLDSGDVISLARQVRTILDRGRAARRQDHGQRRSGRIQDSRHRRVGRAGRCLRRGHRTGHLRRCAVDGHGLQARRSRYLRHQTLHGEVQRGQGDPAGRQAAFSPCPTAMCWPAPPSAALDRKRCCGPLSSAATWSRSFPA